MKKLLLALALALLAAPAFAQTATVVSVCGTPPTTYTAGKSFPLTQDTTGKQCSAASATGTFSSASVGANNTPAPGSSDQIGSQDGSGNLQPASAAHPVPVQVAPAAAGANGTFSKNATVSASGATQLVPASGSTVVSVTGWSCNNTGATSVYATLEDGSGGSQIGQLIECPAGGANNMAPGASWAVTTAGNGLYFTISGSTTSVSMGVVGTQR